MLGEDIDFRILNSVSIIEEGFEKQVITAEAAVIATPPRPSFVVIMTTILPPPPPCSPSTSVTYVVYDTLQLGPHG
jgi:hypothetical protein